MTERELLRRARALRGRTIGEIARWAREEPPRNPSSAKGYVGTLIERALGAQPSHRGGPDFPDLGIELKTVPIGPAGPTQSTWVCVAPIGSPRVPWSRSPARRKLARVLWVPVDATGPFAARRVRTARLWSPSPADDVLLRGDWNLLADALSAGWISQLHARRGRALQVRPKARSGTHWVWAQDAEGEWVRTTPLGFYLRRSFVRGILGT